MGEFSSPKSHTFSSPPLLLLPIPSPQCPARTRSNPADSLPPASRNTVSTSAKIKTRKFASIFKELSVALKVHREYGSYLGGVHLELTGDAVTECVGGSEGLQEDDLSLNYTTYCDPRLNEKQALDLAFLIAGHYREDSPL